jgi:sec-independent protein translocase protein TatC
MDEPQPLLAHLDELRRRLFRLIGAWLACSLVAGIWHKEVFELLMGPAVGALREKGYSLIVISPPELLITYIKSALLAGFLVSLPVTLWQIWAFVAPGLYDTEKRFAIPFVGSSVLLFFGGCTFGYLLAFPFVFEYFLSLEADFIETSWTTREIFSFMSRLYLSFGVAFQLPVAIFFLALAGIVTPDKLASGRKYAVVIMFVGGAILTPPDVVSQVALAVPLVLLYESGIWVSRLVLSRRKTEADEAAPSSS